MPCQQSAPPETHARPAEPVPRRFRRAAALALAILSVSVAATGCSGDVNPVKAAFVEAGYGRRSVRAPDFVEASRREGVGYMTVGESAPQRPLRARSTEDRAALQAELEGARSRNEARGRFAESAAKGATKGTGQGLRGAE